MSVKKNVLIIAGETSGNNYANEFIEAFNKKKYEINFWGIGTNLGNLQNVDFIYNISQTSFVGFWEVFKNIITLKKIFNTTVQKATDSKTDFAILIDYPTFNLKLAEELHALQIPVIWFIAPQVWAWKENRIELLRNFVSELIVIFPFETKYFLQHGIKPNYFGHPLIDKIKKYKSEHILSESNIEQKKTIAYFPGSRLSEVKKHLPIFVETMKTLQGAYNHVVSATANIPIKVYQEFQKDFNFQISFDNYNILANSDCGIIKSGTSTIEAAIFNLPFCAVYKTSFVSYLIGKFFAKVEYIAMPNILANKRVVKEFIQSNFSSKNLVAEVQELLKNKKYSENMKLELNMLFSDEKTLKNNSNNKTTIEKCVEFISRKYL